MPEKRAVLYVRVSSDGQVTNTSLETQKEAGERYCRQQGIELVQIFEEDGESGKLLNRKTLKQALEFIAAKSNNIDYFVFYDYTRFSRDVVNHHAIKALLSRYGVRIKSVLQELDDATATGRFLENVLASAAQFQTEFDTEKKINGIRARLESGIWPFTPPLGYIKELVYIPERNQKYKASVPDTRIFTQLQSTWSLVANKGCTPKQVALHLKNQGVVNPRSEKPITLKYLSDKFFPNRFYVGAVYSSKYAIETKGIHTPMVTENVFYKAQQNLYGGDKIIIKMTQPRYPLKGIICCKNCGKYMTASRSKNRWGKYYAYYHCVVGSPCTDKTRVRADKAEASFTEYINQLKPQKPLLDIIHEMVVPKTMARIKHAQEAQKRAEKEIAVLKDRLAKVYEAFEAGVYTPEIFQERSTALQIEITMKKEELHQVEISESEIITAINYALDTLNDLSNLWKTLPESSKRKIFSYIFPKGIYYEDGESRTLEKSQLMHTMEDFKSQFTSDGAAGSRIEPQRAFQSLINELIIFANSIRLAGGGIS